jgi:hypothetical protein
MAVTVLRNIVIYSVIMFHANASLIFFVSEIVDNTMYTCQSHIFIAPFLEFRNTKSFWSGSLPNDLLKKSFCTYFCIRHWSRFLPVLRFPLPIFIPPIVPKLPLSIIWGWYNRLIVAAVPSGLSLTQLRIIIIKNNISVLSVQIIRTNFV